MTTVNVVSLGCSKNLVDSEQLMARLEQAGARVVFDRRRVDADTVVVINTCGFIGDAKEESIAEILHWGRLRSKGRIARLIVMGCLSERYRKELAEEIPEVDLWRGKHDWADIVDVVMRRSPGRVLYDRMLSGPKHYAYLKISEGCNRKCAFCAIPLITGRFRSRPFDELIAEARMLASRGVKELNVIAQELTSYGVDLYRRNRLAELVASLSDIEGIEWIRLHYAYPHAFPLDVLDVMAERSNVCNYLDIALQHISDPILLAMQRHVTADETRRLLEEMRRRVPGIHIRTTLMTGFPGEGEKEFAELMDFVAEQRFERMGAFAYCEEEGTYAALNLPDSVPTEVKQSRLDRLMALQQDISEAHQQSKVGTHQRVIIDRATPDFWIGRTEFDSPEVDPEVLIPRECGRLKRGQFYDVAVTEASPFELIAKTL